MSLRAAGASHGFVLPVVLGMILLATLIALQAATELGSTALLASQRVLHLRAFEAGEGGIIAVMQQLQPGAMPPASQQLRSAQFPTDAALVETTRIARITLPAGFSAGRVLESDYEIRSTGHSARTTSVTVVQGARQLQPLAAAADCRAATPLPLQVRFGTAAPQQALLESTPAGGLRLLDPATGNEFWSAGAAAGNTQQIAGLDAAFGASFTAVDLDADGQQDRIYAGDRAGRLWRFDLHSGARPGQWLNATVLADLRAAGGGRGFLAAPDITLIETTAGPAWLNIAIGTANIRAQRADHRFYVLRDSLSAAAPATPWSDADLAPLTPPLGTTSSNAPGYYLSLGNAQVLAPALTLDNRIFFTAAESSRDLSSECAGDTLPATAVPLSITALRAADGALDAGHDAAGHALQRILRRAIANALPAGTAVKLAAQVPADGLLPCHIADEPLPECILDSRPQRSWWRREDAD